MAITITENYPPVSQTHLRNFTINFHGTLLTTTVTSTPKTVRKWLRTILHRHARFRRRLLIGLGVQWRPASYSGENPPAATLQLCVGRRCLIFQLLHSRAVPNLLRRFLRNPRHTFVGMWNHSDQKKLSESSRHGLVVGRDPVDLRRHVELGHGVSESRESLVWECLGVDVEFDELVGRSEWEKFELNGDQVLYAAVDAYCSFLIGKGLRAWEL